MNQPGFDPAVFGVPGDTPPIPTTINWDALDPIAYSRTLRELTDWVEWFRQTYRIPATVAPPCWFAHPGIREELGHLWTGWLVTIHPDAGVGMIGLDWDARREQVISRLREGTAIVGCTASAHRDEQPITIQPRTDLLDAHLTHEFEVRSRKTLHVSARQVVLEHLQDLELRHDLAARALADLVEHPATATNEDQIEVARHLKDVAANAQETVQEPLQTAIRTFADVQLTADREDHMAETRADLASHIAAVMLDGSNLPFGVSVESQAWQDALETLLPADIAAERAVAIAANRSASVDRKAARAHRPDVEQLLADIGADPDD